MNACLLSQSVFYEVLNAVSDGVFKETVSLRNNVSRKKEAEKIVLLQVKTWYKLLSSS